MLHDDIINTRLEELYDKAYRNGYQKAVEDLELIKQRMEDMISFLNTKENK